MRRAKKIDNNQREIVALLRSLPGVSVALDKDDILVGYKGANYWYEIKSKNALSRKTGKVLESAKKESQKKLEREWSGHYRICSNVYEILGDLGIEFVL